MSIFDPYQINKRRVKKSHKGQIIQQRPSKNYFAISPDELPRSLQVIKSYFPSLLHHRKSVLISLQPTEYTSLSDYNLSFNSIWQLVRNQFKSELNFPINMVNSFQLNITTLSIQYQDIFTGTGGNPFSTTLKVYSDNEENISYTDSSDSRLAHSISIFPDDYSRFCVNNNDTLTISNYLTNYHNSSNWINRSIYTDFNSVRNNQIPDTYRYLTFTSEDLTIDIFRYICIVLEVSIDINIK